MSGHLEYRGKDKLGRHRVRWRYRSPENQDRFLSKTFVHVKKREAERLARAWGADQADRVAKRKWSDPRAELTFAAVAEQWRATWPGLQPRTKSGYDHILRLHVLPAFGSAKVGDIGVGAIERWLADLAATRTRATIERIYGVLRGVMKLAKRGGYIDENPCADVQLPRRRAITGNARHRQLFLTAAEVNAVANAVRAVSGREQDRVAVYVAAWCGLRAGELWGLRYRDVNLVTGQLTVAQALKETNGVPTAATWMPADERGLFLGPPKSAASRRTLTIPEPVTQLLAAHIQANGSGDPDALVFTAPEGGPVRHSLFYNRAWLPAVKRVFPADHPKRKLRWHDLRHTCAALSLAVAGGDLHVVKERLGHEKIATTVDTYGHLLPDAEDQLARGLADLFNAAAEPDSNVVPLHRSGSAS